MKYDVVIVGGGTAGLMLARELANQQKSVLIVDQKDNLLKFSFKTLASFMRVSDFDLSEKVVAQNIDSAFICSSRFKHRLKAKLCILDKEVLHQELLNSLNKDFVDIKLNTSIKRILKNEEGVYTALEDKNKNLYKGNIFVDASGTAGVISKKEGLRDADVEIASGVEYNVKYLGNPNHLYLFFGKEFKGGYGWIFPLKNQRAIIGFGTVDKAMKKHLKSTLNKILESPRIKKLVEKDNNVIEGGSIPITPVLDKFVNQNLVCVGDSVSQVNPIVGEGYKFIFEAAIMASKAINKSLDQKSISLLSEYENEWRKRFLANYKRSKVAQERVIKLSNNDVLSNLAMLVLAKLRTNQKNVNSLSGEYY